MKKFLLTTVFSLGLLATPAWGVWYSTDERDVSQDDDEGGTVHVPFKDVDIYFTAQGNQALQTLNAGDTENQVDEIEELFNEHDEMNYGRLIFYRAQNQADLDLMQMSLERFARNCDEIRCEQAAQQIQAAWDALYQDEMNQVNREREQDQERSRRHQQRREDLQESNPGAEISDSSDSERGDSDGDGSYSDSDRAGGSDEESGDFVEY